MSSHLIWSDQVEEGEDGVQMNSTTPNIMAIYSALQTPRIGLTPIPSPTPVPAVAAAPTYTSVGVGTNMVPGEASAEAWKILHDPGD